jgi:hypothetical protein
MAFGNSTFLLKFFHSGIVALTVTQGTESREHKKQHYSNGNDGAITKYYQFDDSCKLCIILRIPDQ